MADPVTAPERAPVASSDLERLSDPLVIHSLALHEIPLRVQQIIAASEAATVARLAATATEEVHDALRRLEAQGTPLYSDRAQVDAYDKEVNFILSLFAAKDAELAALAAERDQAVELLRKISVSPIHLGHVLIGIQVEVRRFVDGLTT